MTKLIAYGDSIFAGWNGQSSTPDNQRIPELVGQAIGAQVSNYAVSGAKFGADSADFPKIINQNPATGYDYVLINYGVNNFTFPNGGLDDIAGYFKQGLELIKSQAPNAIVLVELPTQDFRNGVKTLFDLNDDFWPQNQLMDRIAQVCQSQGVAYLDWRDDPIITYDNASYTLGDGQTGVHPTTATMAKIADRLSAKLKTLIGSTNSQPSSTTSQASTTTSTSQTTSTADTKPAKITLEPLTLIKLSTVNELKSNLSDNNKAVVDYLDKLNQTVNGIFGSDNQSSAKVVDVPATDLINRALRDYMFDVFGTLELAINGLIGTTNTYGLLDVTTGQATGTVSLNPPTTLVLDDDFINTINQLWKTIEDTLNRLLSYANNF